MSINQTKIPKKAIKIAKYSNVRSGKLSAIAFSHSGKIIATAHNRKVYGHRNIFTQHAEQVLILKLNRLNAFERFNDITILVVRINVHGVSMAKPCKKCHKLLSKYPVNILYSGWDKQIHSY